MKIASDNIIELKANEIFVFGSNLRGYHLAGAALTAAKRFGARYGIGTGLVGQSYAIPTMDENIKPLSLSHIASHVRHFIQDARLHPELTFFVTPIGCGLGGKEPKDIALMFYECLDMENVYLPKSFIDILNK